MLRQNPTKTYTSLLINNPIFHIHGYYFGSNSDLISQASVVLNMQLNALTRILCRHFYLEVLKSFHITSQCMNILNYSLF